MGRRERERRSKMPPGVSIDRLAEIPTYATVGRRPLDEFTAHPSVRTGVDIELVDNNHTDSRKNFPDLKMNRSAMQAIARHTEAVNHTLAFLNLNYFGTTVPDSITAQQADELAMLGIWLPSYLVLRGRKPVEPTQLPETAGELYKLAQGIHSSTELLRKKYGDDYPVTGHTVYTMANTLQPGKKSLFVSDDGLRICPAMPRKIEDTTGVLLTRPAGDPARSELNRFITREEFPRLKDFSLVSMGYVSDVLVVSDEAMRLRDNLERGGQVSPLGNIIPMDRGAIMQDLRSLHVQHEANRERAQRRFNQALGRDPLRIAG
jgi:hypothetical protein